MSPSASIQDLEGAKPLQWLDQRNPWRDGVGPVGRPEAFRAAALQQAALQQAGETGEGDSDSMSGGWSGDEDEDEDEEGSIGGTRMLG